MTFARPVLQRPVADQLQPTHSIAFPGADHIFGAEFSGDGRFVYCLVNGKSVDLWALGVEWWPEVLGCMAGVVLVCWVVVLVRVRRRAQVVGVPHCRRCNYNVASQARLAAERGAARVPAAAGTLCPECGVDLSVKRPRRGRSMVRRVWLATVVMALVVLGYAGMLAARLPRDGWVGARWGVWSEWVDGYAAAKNPAWLQKHFKPVWRLMRVATATGRIEGNVRTLRRYPIQMKMAPDGRHVAITTDSERIEWIDTRSGRLRGSLKTGKLGRAHNSESIVGFEERGDGTWVYFAESDWTDKRSRLVRWNPRTGARVVVIDEEAKGLDPKAIVFPRKYALLHWPEGVATVSAPDFMSTSRSDDTYPLTIRAPEVSGGAILRSIEVDEHFVMMSPLVPTADGSVVFLSTMSSGIVGVDARSGEHVGRLTASTAGSVSDVFAISANGVHLLVPALGLWRSVECWETAERRRVARLEYPAPFIAPWMSSSRDGRWVAAVPFKSTGGPAGPYVYQLFLYDIGVLEEKPLTP